MLAGGREYAGLLGSAVVYGFPASSVRVIHAGPPVRGPPRVSWPTAGTAEVRDVVRAVVGGKTPGVVVSDGLGDVVGRTPSSRLEMRELLLLVTMGSPSSSVRKLEVGATPPGRRVGEVVEVSGSSPPPGSVGLVVGTGGTPGRVGDVVASSAIVSVLMESNRQSRMMCRG